jgi:hypothetical protein
MEKTSLRGTDGSHPRFRHSTVRRAIRSAQLTGRLFSEKDGEAQRAGETITEGFGRPFERMSRANDRSAGGRRKRIVSFQLLRSHPFVAALLAISLIDSGPVFPRTQSAAREPMVIATAATEFVHDRIRLELPRIITWRPLPVTPPELRRRARPRAAPTPNPKAG